MVQCLFCKFPGIQELEFKIIFFLLKTKIHTHILHTEPFLCNKRGPRYLQNKMGFWNSSICKGFRLAKQIMGDHIKKEVSKIIFLGTFCFQIQSLVHDLKCFKLFKNILENWVFARDFCWWETLQGWV